MEKERKINIKIFLLYWLLILACYVPIWLAFFPGIATYDANIQVMYIMEGKLSTHHPILHSLYLGGLYKLGYLLNKDSMGIDWYAISQMIIISGIFAYSVSCLRDKGINGIVCFGGVLFYGLFPVNAILAISTTKDVIFSGLVLLFVISMLNTWGREKYSRKKYICYIVISVLMLLFRSNAFYAWVISVPIICFFVKKKKKFIICSILTGLIYIICSEGLIMITGAEKGSPIELLSVPAQQMARVGYYHKEELEDDSLIKYIPAETIQKYNPYLADNIKFNMNANNVRNDKVGFIREWIKLGVRYPRDYIQAFMDNCRGFWSISDISYTDIYGRKSEGLGYLMDIRLSYNGILIGKEHSYFPKLKKLYHNLFMENGYLKWPIIRYIFAPAFWWWALVLIVVIAVCKHKYKLLLPAIFLSVYYISLLFGPACLVRYIYPIMVCVPFLGCNLMVKDM